MPNDTQAEIIQLYVTPGHAFEGALYLRVTPQYQDELDQLLDENGLNHSEVVQFSAGIELAIIAVAVSAPFVHALAKVINTFLRRHDGKKVILRPGEVEVSGYSRREAEAVIEAIIEEAMDKQAELNANWKPMLDAAGQEKAREVGGPNHGDGVDAQHDDTRSLES
jgi:hypothetical protein